MKYKVLKLSLLTVLAAQIKINLMYSDFNISIGIIMFSVFVLIIGNYPVLKVAILTAPLVFLSRILMGFSHTYSFEDILMSHGPEVVFYLVYGILTFLYFRNIKFNVNKFVKLFPLFFCDYLANLAELLIREGLGAFNYSVQLVLLVIAVIRLFMICGIYEAFKYQNFYFLKKEHIQRYEKLLLLISKLKCEVILMDKNTDTIENTMSTSYKLYNKLKESYNNDELSDQALSVAKDIHEIKKEYGIIMRGISDALKDSVNDTGMNFRDIFIMLKDKYDLENNSSGKKILWNVNLQYDFYTTKHYYIISILRNLIDNAIEASKENSVTIYFSVNKLDDIIYINVTDYSGGIPECYIKMIYNPGFSTKIDYNTGIINRGLGLSLIKDLVINKLNGEIFVNTKDKETTFLLKLPNNVVED